MSRFPFGSPNPATVTFENAMTNSGCVDLTIDSVIFDENSNNTSPALFTALNTVNEERLGRLDAQDRCLQSEDRPEMVLLPERDYRDHDAVSSKSLMSQNAAYAPPAFLLSLVSPTPGTILAPNNVDTILRLLLPSNSTLITRGYHPFYAYVYTDDPDYFLDSARHR